jgi:hypothetical protein
MVLPSGPLCAHEKNTFQHDCFGWCGPFCRVVSLPRVSVDDGLSFPHTGIHVVRRGAGAFTPSGRSRVGFCRVGHAVLSSFLVGVLVEQSDRRWVFGARQQFDLGCLPRGFDCGAKAMGAKNEGPRHELFWRPGREPAFRLDSSLTGLGIKPSPRSGFVLAGQAAAGPADIAEGGRRPRDSALPRIDAPVPLPVPSSP